MTSYKLCCFDKTCPGVVKWFMAGVRSGWLLRNIGEELLSIRGGCSIERGGCGIGWKLVGAGVRLDSMTLGG